MAKNNPKIAPDTDVLSTHKAQEIPFFLVMLIQLWVVCLRMLSIGLHLALLRPNLSAMRLQMTVSEKLQAAHDG